MKVCSNQGRKLTELLWGGGGGGGEDSKFPTDKINYNYF